jgi:S-adenosylmethionine-dependent methyltransferase
MVAETTGQAFDDEVVANRYLDHLQTIRGIVRTAIVQRHLLSELPLENSDPFTVLDVGCGDGSDAVWLARLGHEVWAWDTSAVMLDHAREKVADSGAKNRAHLSRAGVSELEDISPDRQFDLVISHGVLMYFDDPSSFLRAHMTAVRDGGWLSLLTKNALIQPFRAFNEGRIHEAMRLLDDSRGFGHLGIQTRSHSIQEIADVSAENGALVTSIAGVRIFTDRSAWDPDVADPDQIIDLEWKAAKDTRYREAGALLHFILQKGVDLRHLPNDPVGP